PASARRPAHLCGSSAAWPRTRSSAGSRAKAASWRAQCRSTATDGWRGAVALVDEFRDEQRDALSQHVRPGKVADQAVDGQREHLGQLLRAENGLGELDAMALVLGLGLGNDAVAGVVEFN